LLPTNRLPEQGRRLLKQKLTRKKSTDMNNKTHKSVYAAPTVERIELDNEIALQLESSMTPPKAPGEAMNTAPEYFNNDPFKSNRG